MVPAKNYLIKSEKLPVGGFSKGHELERANYYTGGNSLYDGMITCTTLSGKAVCRLV